MNLKEQMNSGKTSTKIQKHKEGDGKQKQELIRTEEYNNCREEQTRRNQHQVRWSRGSNQWCGRQGSKKTPNQNSKKEKGILKNDSLRALWDNIKPTNICTIRVPEEDRKIWTGNLFEEIIMENFPNLAKETDVQVQESESPKQEEPNLEVHTKTHN